MQIKNGSCFSLETLRCYNISSWDYSSLNDGLFDDENEMSYSYYCFEFLICLLT